MKVRKIKIVSWTESSQSKPDTDITVDTCIMMRNLVASLPAQSLPRGVEAFELMRDLSQALRDAENKEYLLLPESVYSFLEKQCFPHIPSTWGLMKEVADAVSLLIGAEIVDLNLAQPEPDVMEEE